MALCLLSGFGAQMLKSFADTMLGFLALGVFRVLRSRITGLRLVTGPFALAPLSPR
jgi:hypothetical protein